MILVQILTLKNFNTDHCISCLHAPVWISILDLQHYLSFFWVLFFKPVQTTFIVWHFYLYLFLCFIMKHKKKSYACSCPTPTNLWTNDKDKQKYKNLSSMLVTHFLCINEQIFIILSLLWHLCTFNSFVFIYAC